MKAAAAAYGSAEEKPITAAIADDVSMVARMKRRLPKRSGSSLPPTLAHTPSSPIALATVAGAISAQPPAPCAAQNVRNATTQPRSADVSHVCTQYARE